MDRILVQPSEIPTDTMFLLTNKNAMIALGYLAQAILGTSTVVDGFSCGPTSPASLSVMLSTGSMYSFQNIDSTAYGTIAADTTDQIVKQGILLGNTTLSCPAPVTPGQSINYLVEIAFGEEDTNAQNVEFYNSANPSSPLTSNINTLRQAVCVLAVKAGASATTGTQTTPAPDAGYTGLYVVTVAYGQTTITGGNIQQLASAPFISPKLPYIISSLQNGGSTYAQDTSGAANTITVALSPALTSYVAGQPIKVKVANTTTSGAAVMNVNGLGNVAIYDTEGNALHAGALKANSTYTFVYDGSHMVLQAPPADTMMASNNLSDLTSITSALAILGFGNSISSSGYQKLGGGALILQWGTTASIAAGSSVAATFTVNFPNNVFAVVATPVGVNTNANPEGFGVAKNLGGITVYNWGSTIAYSSGVSYFAIGN